MTVTSIHPSAPFTPMGFQADSCTADGVRVEVWRQDLIDDGGVAIGLGIHIGGPGATSADFTPLQLRGLIEDLTKASAYLDALGDTDEDGILR